MKELPLVSLFCSCFLSDPLNKPAYKYEGRSLLPTHSRGVPGRWELGGLQTPPPTWVALKPREVAP